MEPPTSPPSNEEVPGQPLRTTGQLFQSGETLTAQHVAGLRTNYEADTTALDGWDRFSIRRSANGEFVVTWEDQTHTFTADQIVEYRAEFEDFWFGLWTAEADLEELIAEDDYFEVLATGFEGGDDVDRRGYVVVGSPTTDFSAISDVTATYDGRAVVEVYDAEEYMGTANSRERFRGDATLTADFSNSTIAGRLDNFESDSGSNEEESVVLTMPETPIVNGSFDGDFTASGLEADETLNATYEGSFYGPDADAAAGVISGTYSEPGYDGNLIGFFQAGRTNNE